MPGYPGWVQYFALDDVRERPPAGQGGIDMLYGTRTRLLFLVLAVLIAVAGGELDGWTWT